MTQFTFSKNYSFDEVSHVLVSAQDYRLNKAYEKFDNLNDIMNYLCHVYTFFRKKYNTNATNIPNSVKDVLDYSIDDSSIILKISQYWTYKDYNTKEITGNYITVKISKEMVNEVFNDNPNLKLFNKSNKLSKDYYKIAEYTALKRQIVDLEKQLDTKRKKLETILKLIKNYDISENCQDIDTKLKKLRDVLLNESFSLKDEYFSKINYI